VTIKLNDYLDFPYVGQTFAIERESIDKKTKKVSRELVYGIASQADFDEDRCRIRTGHGPKNIARLRRFVVGVIKATSLKGVSETMRKLTMNIRMVFDYLKMTKNSAKPR